MEKERKFKVSPVRLASDDCLVYTDRVIENGKITNQGTPHQLHKSEWIEIIPIGTVQEFIGISGLAPTADTATQGRSFEMLCKGIAARIVNWNWTDNESEPLPCPYKQPEVIKSLSSDEVFYLFIAIQGETIGQRKKESAPSGITS